MRAIRLLRSSTRRAGTVVLIALVLGLGVIGLTPRPSYADGTFASITLPGGVAAGIDKVLASRPIGCASSREIRIFQLIGGTVTNDLFAKLPNRNEEECSEDHLAISPGLGGFSRDVVYVLLGRQIKQIPSTGGTGENKDGGITDFATIPAPCGPTGGTSQNSIMFDKVGSFQFAMLVLCSNGPLWRVDATGFRTFIVDVSGSLTPPFESIDVALPHFKPFGGCVLGAGEADTTLIGENSTAGTVFAACPNGTVSALAKWPRAETVAVIPPVTWNCFPDGAFFAARSSDILKIPKTAFVTEDGTRLNGQALVLSGPGGGEGAGQGIGLLRSVTNPTTGVSQIVVSTFRSSGKFQGAAFCGTLRLPPGSVKVNPEHFQVTPEGEFMVTIFTSDRLNAADIDPSRVRAGANGFEASPLRCELTEGGRALKCHFKRRDSGFPLRTTVDMTLVTGFTKGSADPAFCGGD